MKPRQWSIPFPMAIATAIVLALIGRAVDAQPPAKLLPMNQCPTTQRVDSLALYGVTFGTTGKATTLQWAFADSVGHAIHPRNPRWSVADTTIATVSNQGVLTGKQNGRTVVTMRSSLGVVRWCMVVVPIVSIPITPT